MQHLKTVSVMRPKAGQLGLSHVIVERANDQGVMTSTLIGYIHNGAGIEGYAASVKDGDVLPDRYATRSKAAHAVRFIVQADERQARKNAKIAAPVAAPVPAIDEEQAKKDKRNARRRQLRAMKKASQAA